MRHSISRSAHARGRRRAVAAVSAVAALCGALSACGSGGTDTLAADPPASLAGDASRESSVAAPACVQALAIGADAPLDIVFVVDRSVSMAGAKWDAVSHALLAFVDQGFPSPTQAALSFIPYPIESDLVSGEQIKTNYHTCDYRLYRDFRVPLGDLSSSAQRGALENGFASAVRPSGEGFGDNSPIYAALQGTYFTTAKLQNEHSDHQVIVILVGDGDANACPQYSAEQTTAASVASLAASALAYNGVRTFAVGTSGTGFGLLQTVAAAGGGTAFTITTATAEDLLFQMQKIKALSVGCSFVLPAAPAGEELDPGAVTVAITSGAGDLRKASLSPSFGRCASNESYYFDNAAKPSRVNLCPAACAALKGDPRARVAISFACKGVVK